MNTDQDQFSPGCSFRLIVGPARSGLTTRLIEEVKPALWDPEPRRVLWLVPSHQTARRLREQLVDSGIGASLSIWIGTFDSLAAEVLARSGVSFRPIGGKARWELIHLLIRKLGIQEQLQYFLPIANTPGLTDRLNHWISRCQRVGVDPNGIRQTLDGEPSARMADFLRIFSEYQETSRRNRWLDAQQRLWEASRLLREGSTDFLHPCEIVVLDGFLELLPAELAILQTLGQHARKVFATLILDRRRPDLFSKTRRTRERLVSLFGRSSLQEEYEDRSTYFEAPGLCHLERRLFLPPGKAPPANNTTGIKILVGANLPQEVELVAQEIKGLLVDGDPEFGVGKIRPTDIVVVVPSFAEYGDRIWQTFREFGIPTFVEGGFPLSRVGIVRAFLTLVGLEVEGWRLPTILAVLRNRYFHSAWLPEGNPTVLADVENVLRSLNIAGGKEVVLERLKSRVSQQSAEQEGEIEDCSPDLRTLRVLAELADHFSSWENPAPWAVWLNRWKHLAQKCGLVSELVVEEAASSHWVRTAGSSSLISPEEEEKLKILDRRAWRALWSKLDDLKNLYTATGMADQDFTSTEAFELLRRVASRTAILPEFEETGRVRVLSPATVSGLSAPYVFVMGLREGNYPTPMPELAVWNEDEVRRLGKLGIDPVSITAKVEEEMLLFYRVVTRASRRLFLSYPAADEKGEPLLPSPFLEEIELACGKDSITKHLPENLSPLPRGQYPFTYAHWRILAVHQALSGRIELLERLCGSEGDSQLGAYIQRGLVLRVNRGKFGVFTAYDGMLEGKRIREALRELFQKQPRFSPTVLENYAACPFRFLLRDMLKIEPPAEVKVETDFLQRGRRFHEALAKFHQTLIERCGRAVCFEDVGSEIPEEELTDIWEQSFVPPEDENPSALAAAGYELDKRQWLALGPVYLEQWQNYDKYCRDHFGTVFKPKWFERLIGGQRNQEGVPPEPFLLELNKREALLLHGRIDRIDIAQCGEITWVAILDYKSGSSPPVPPNSWRECLENGIGLQLALYLLAAEEKHVHPPPVKAIFGGYWMLFGRGLAERSALPLYEICSPKDRAGKNLMPTNLWKELRDEIVPQTCWQILQAIRRGEFPPAPNSEAECRFCPYRTVCRVGECRDLTKTWTWKESSSPPGKR